MSLRGGGERGVEPVLATNTCSLLVTEIAVAATLPERVVGMHFFNPPNDAPRTHEGTSALIPVFARPMISFWICEVPSYRVVTRTSRK
jgi:3-hydroxyacyl-CoA dehydrogenase, NAD binding domain